MDSIPQRSLRRRAETRSRGRGISEILAAKRKSERSSGTGVRATNAIHGARIFPEELRDRRSELVMTFRRQ
jgi:hypothetical protein